MACTVALAFGSALAGDLTPPVGPVSSTMKPLTDVEPRTAVNAENTPGDADSVFRIVEPGSYYLTGDVGALAGEHGIQIASSDVTLDLNGFSIHVSAPGTLTGVHVEGQQVSLEIKNGNIRGFNDGGIGGGPLVRARVIDMRVTNILGVGVTLGANSTIRDCTLDSNDSGNVVIGDFSIIESCTATNSANGLGISTGTGCTLRNCVANGNGAGGIAASSVCQIDACTARSNTGNGISAGTSSIISQSTSSVNSSHGIVGGTYCNIIDCSADLNTLSGIRATNRNKVSNCSANDNNQHGVHITFAGVVESCFLAKNTINGIRMDDGGATTIQNNTISESQIGIAVRVGGGNRIEGNSVTFCSASGIDVATIQNCIIRNYGANQPSDYVVIANNIFGPIVTTGTVGASNNPHSNYQFP